MGLYGIILYMEHVSVPKTKGCNSTGDHQTTTRLKSMADQWGFISHKELGFTWLLIRVNYMNSQT